MATATKQARTARQREQRAVDGAPSKFVVVESNTGEYRWEVLSGTGATLAQSVSFASSGDAEAAAVSMRDGAGSTQLELRKDAAQEGMLVGAPRSRAAKAR